jgi:hypothetical protein
VATAIDPAQSSAESRVAGDGDEHASAPPAAVLPRDAAAADPVEVALAKALEEASGARRWDVVARLAGELEARRLARLGNVVPLTGATRLGRRV